MSKELGQVYKAHSNKFFVKTKDRFIQCDARGLLKIKSDGILTGDIVEVENSTILSVKPRKNRLIRPSVANIDLIVAVLSPQPKPDFYLIDKLYINSVKENVDFCLVLNKSDIESNVYEEIVKEYSNLGIKILSVSSANKDGIIQLKELLRDKLSVFAGQSAVGKTSITNAMFNLELPTGEVSEKIERGRHTTTRSEIFEYEGIKVIDSPGFAVIDADVSIDDLPQCYPEYFEVSSECKFRGCSHISEPNCKVKELVSNGVFSKNRYERYIEIYNEIKNRRNIYEKN